MLNYQIKVRQITDYPVPDDLELSDTIPIVDFGNHVIGPLVTDNMLVEQDDEGGSWITIEGHGTSLFGGIEYYEGDHKIKSITL